MRKQTSKIDGFKYILMGLFAMALGSCAIEVISLFKKNDILGWLSIGIFLLGWIIVTFGMYQIRVKRREFKQNFIIVILGGAFILIEGLLAFNEMRSGIEEGVFIAIGVMFFEYLSNLCVLGTYFLMMKGISQLLAKGGNAEKGISGMKMAKISIAVILVTMLTTPFAYLFPPFVTFIVAGISIATSLVMQLRMMDWIKRNYKEA